MAILKRLVGAGLVMLLSTATASPLSLYLRSADVSSCPGYKATNIKTSATGLTADLTLAGTPCNIYGTDIKDLTLNVEYQTSTRLHVLIQDQASQIYQVPSSFFTRPESEHVLAPLSEIEFKYVANPFSFSVVRRSNNQVLFDTSAAQLVFETQYLRLRTKLPSSPSLYGLGEHTDPFMLNTSDYTRTFWARDAYGVGEGTNLYGDHPVYFDHRGSQGTHAVFLLNSNGIDVKIDNTDGQYLEYNAIGGVLDFYFLAGPTPLEVAQQYSLVVGKSAMFPYWGLGFHQCRYGMQDVYEVAEVVANYSAAFIPLETMWTDIDYMYLRRVFTVDPYRFPLKLMRELVSTLHDNDQHYVMMVDPAVAKQDYPPFNDGVSSDSFLALSNGSVYEGVVWPGVTVFPDWFASGTQGYWTSQFADFFSASDGVDIDALWIDMNEASNFCTWPCSDPEAYAKANDFPPHPPQMRLGSPRNISGFPEDFQPQCKAEVTFNVDASTYYGENIYVWGSAVTIGGSDFSNSVELSATDYPIWSVTVDLPANTNFSYQYVRSESDGSWIYEKANRTHVTLGCGSSSSTNDTITTSSGSQSKLMIRRSGSENVDLETRASGGSMLGLSGRDLINPPYTINNAAGSLSNKTIRTDLVHQNGLVEYDTHNMYGAMMSEASRQALLARRSSVRPLVITRSTFAGSGSKWDHYLSSIREVLEFAALYQVPMVGADVCGFGDTTNDKLCARWASLGAFTPFYRNHGEAGYPPHEYYRWGNDSIVAESARNAIAIRYQLLDYIYTAMYVQSQTGTPLVQPMFFAYPDDKGCNSLQYQYLYGPGILVAPVNLENSTTTTVYLPNDIFYDFYTHDAVQGKGAEVTLTNVDYTTIPLYYKSGSIVALRSASAYTTTELRKQNFNLVIAPGQDGSAQGELYLDDGDSLVQAATSYIEFTYKGGVLTMSGSFKYNAGVVIESVEVLGQGGKTTNLNWSPNGPKTAKLQSGW